MNKKQEARFTMANDVVRFMDLNSKIWENDTVITNIVNQIKKSISDVNTTLKQQSITTKGYTESKKKIRSKIDDDLNYLLSAFRTYAKITNNDVLYEEANLTPSKIKRIKDTEIIPLMEKSLAYANEHLKDLEPYGIREAGLKSAQKNLDDYKDFLSMPKDIRAQRAAATKKLKTQINDLVKIFDEMLDNAMVKYWKTHPDFYNQYLETRIIYDNPTHHGAIIGIVTDEETKEPLEYVTVHFRPGSDLASSTKGKQKKTSPQGHYEFTNLPEGKGEVVFEKPYYDPLKIPVEIIPRKTLRVDVALRKTE